MHTKHTREKNWSFAGKKARKCIQEKRRLGDLYKKIPRQATHI
jgi:hypothetical protein